MKNSAKAMNRNGSFRYVAQKFSWISDTKVREKIFVDPQIKEGMNDRNFDEVLETACEAFLTFGADGKRPSTGSWMRKYFKVVGLWGAICH
jgi:hypothetical protein